MNEYKDANEFFDILLKPVNMKEIGEVSEDVINSYKEIKTVLTEVVKDNVDKTFGDRVKGYIDELQKRRNMFPKDSKFYQTAFISNKTFYRIRDDKIKPYRPGRNTVWKICFALELDQFKTKQLLESAKYHIDNDDERDKALMECINKKIYNIVDVDIYLDERGIELLSKLD